MIDTAPDRSMRRIWALVLCGMAWALIPGTAWADHHQALQRYGIDGFMTRSGFLVSRVYDTSEAQDGGLVPGDLIVRGNGDLIGNPDDIVEDLNNSRNGDGPAVFLVWKGRTGRYVQVTAIGR